MNRRAFLQSTAGSLVGAVAGAATDRRNILFIAVDDLRPDLGCYGNRIVRTPNIDRLAAGGVVFRNAHCQVAVCNPSRSSVLTGLRPDSTQVFNLGEHFRAHVPDAVTLPQSFRAAGYQTRSFGKIYHGGLDDPPSWSVPSWPAGRNRGMEYIDVEKLSKSPRPASGPEYPRLTWKKGPSWQAPDVPDDALQDGESAVRAINALREFQDTPFFLAVGFLKPHLPFVAPKRYFDLYAGQRFELPADRQAVSGAPSLAGHAWEELRGYTDIPKQGPLRDQQVSQLIRAYYSAISYMDAQVGRVLNELDRLDLARRTIVVLWGDHGYHLGEQDLWCKATNFELDTRCPLIVRAPGASAQGQTAGGLVELVDLFPTLCDLAQVKPPSGLEGFSFAPLLRQPNRRWKKAVFSQFGRPWLGNARWQAMGRSIRTDRFRYVEWRDRREIIQARELYDYKQASTEERNLAGEASYRETIASLAWQLESGWRTALPGAGR